MYGVAEYWYSLVLSGFVRSCDGKAEYCRILSCGGEAGCGIVMCSVGEVLCGFVLFGKGRVLPGPVLWWLCEAEFCVVQYSDGKAVFC